MDNVDNVFQALVWNSFALPIFFKKLTLTTRQLLHLKSQQVADYVMGNYHREQDYIVCNTPSKVPKHA